MADSSFLASPDEILDWRRVVLSAAAIRNGLFAALPGTEDDLAVRSGLDVHSTRVMLDALAVWLVVVKDSDIYSEGPEFPNSEEQLVLKQHAQFMQRWGGQIDDRMTDRLLDHHPPRSSAALEAWLLALGVNAKEKAPGIVGRCLDYFDATTSVLDVACGHGEYGIEAGRHGCQVTLLDIPEVIRSLTGRGGDTHRLEDYTKWMTDAGFDAPLVDDLGGRSLLLARKPVG